MATVKRKIGTALLAAVLAASMSVTAFAAESYTVPDNAKGGTPSLLQQSGDGYSSITIYDGVEEVKGPQYTGGMQGDFSQVGQPNPTKYYPFEITNIDEQGTWLVVKSYEVPEGVDAQNELVEHDMIRNGTRYEARDILLKKTPGNTDSREASKKVTITSGTKDKTKLMAQLEETTFYAEAGYEGYLKLDPDSIKTEVSSTTNYSYPITEKKEYTNLDRNDPSLLEKTITKNGVTLKLGDVNWMSMGSTVSGSSIVSSYKAVATYTGTAYGSKADGYIVTANYTGVATKEVAGDYIYSIIYAPATESPAAPATPPTDKKKGGNTVSDDNGNITLGDGPSVPDISAGFNDFGIGPVRGWGLVGAIGLLALLVAGIYFLVQKLKDREVVERRPRRKAEKAPRKFPAQRPRRAEEDEDEDEEDYKDEDEDDGDYEDDDEDDDDIDIDDDASIYLPPRKNGVVSVSVDDDPELSALFEGGNADDENDGDYEDESEDDDEPETEAADAGAEEDPEPEPEAMDEEDSLEFTEDENDKQ